MKFIFPKNYRYRSKILGFLDYVTALVDLVVGIFLFLFIKLFVQKITVQVYIFIILFVPIVLLSVFVLDGENIIDYFYMIVVFCRRRGVYLYQRKYDDNKKKKLKNRQFFSRIICF